MSYNEDISEVVHDTEAVDLSAGEILDNCAVKQEAEPKKVSLKYFGANEIIDLETGNVLQKKLTGPELLFQNYLKTVKQPKHKETVCMNILNFENGKLESEKIQVKLDKEIELDHNRPGLSRELLKENLRNQIQQKRLEDIKRRSLKKECTVELEPENKSPTKHKTEEDNATNSLESDDEDYEPEFLAEEAIDNDESANDSVSSESASEEEELSNAVPKKSRILQAFIDSDDEESKNSPEKEEQNLNESQASDFTFDEPSVSENMLCTDINALINANEQQSQVNDDDLMQLCSGQFFTQSEPVPPSQHFDTAELLSIVDKNTDDFITQVPDKLESEKYKQKEENVGNIIPKERRRLESSDDESDAEISKERTKIKKKRKSKNVKLNFSNDSESESDENIPESTSLQESETEEASKENNNVYVDYDSEENEIEVKVSKKEIMKTAEKYFENEAELSESEWGSADEDERGLDSYAIELGDEEQFDQEKLQEEVGRIHARKVLDEDIRNVKKIQNLLFEDEENDGVGRERKFRWKNQTEEGFSLVDENAQDIDDILNVDENEENEAMWRRMRHERETLINEQSQKMLESETFSEDILLLDQNSQTVTSSNTTSLVKRKFQIIKNSSFGSMNSENKMDSPFLIKNSSCKFTSSSFLTRDERTLTRIASFMSNKDDEVTNLSSHGGNSMSFAPIEKPDDTKKRKSNSEQKNSDSKKRKVDSQSFLLEQLH